MLTDQATHYTQYSEVMVLKLTLFNPSQNRRAVYTIINEICQFNITVQALLIHCSQVQYT